MASARLLPLFLQLFRLRHRYFSTRSRALYERYAQALGVVLAMFGLVLVGRPTLLAAPLLHFAGPASGWQSNAVVACAYLLVVALWARVHRDFVRGAAHTGFVRISLHGRRLAPMLDMALLLASLAPFAIPFGIAAWQLGELADWAALILLALMTVALARGVCFGIGRASLLRQAMALIVLVFAGAAGPRAGAVAQLGAAALLMLDLMLPVAAPAAGRHAANASGVLRGPGWLFLLTLQWQALLRRHLHVVLPRIGVALALHAAALYMISVLGKRDEAAGFLAVAGCVSAYAMSGLYYAFWSARQPLQSYLASLPRGETKVLVAEHLLALGIGVIVFGAVALGARPLLADAPALVALATRIAAQSLLLLPLLGLPILQRHRHGTPCKVALTVAAILLIHE